LSSSLAADPNQWHKPNKVDRNAISMSPSRQIETAQVLVFACVMMMVLLFWPRP